MAKKKLIKKVSARVESSNELARQSEAVHSFMEQELLNREHAAEELIRLAGVMVEESAAIAALVELVLQHPTHEDDRVMLEEMLKQWKEAVELYGRLSDDVVELKMWSSSLISKSSELIAICERLRDEAA